MFLVSKLRSSTLAHNAGWMFVGQGLSVVLQCVYFMMLGRLLGSTEYGIYMGAVALAALLSQYSVLGSGWVFLQYVSLDHSLFARYWGNILISSCGIGGALVVTLCCIGPHVSHAYSYTMLVCIGIGDCICMQLAMATGSVFQAFEKLHLTALVNILVSIFRVLLAGSLFVICKNVNALQWSIAALCVSSLAVCCAVLIVCKNFGRPKFSFALWKHKAEEGFIYSLSSSTDNVYSNFDKVLLGHYGMHEANGIYSMAYKAVMTSVMPAASIEMAAVPRIFQRKAEGVTGICKYMFRIMRGTVPVAILVSCMIYVLAPISPHLVGKSFAQSVGAMQLLCLLPITRVFQFSAGDALTGAGKQRYRLGTQAIAAIANLGLNVWLIPRYGWHGAAWANISTDAFLGALNWSVVFVLRLKEMPQTA